MSCIASRLLTHCFDPCLAPTPVSPALGLNQADFVRSLTPALRRRAYLMHVHPQGTSHFHTHLHLHKPLQIYPNAMKAPQMPLSDGTYCPVLALSATRGYV